VTDIDPTPGTDADRVRAACEILAAASADITFAAVATESGISRATCYRHRELRTIIDRYRSRHGDMLTLTGLADRVDNLTQALDAIAAKVRRQEEEIRALKRHAEKAANQPTRKKTAD
jgi:ACT domain-containing protein